LENNMELQWATLVWGLVIFLSRIADVSAGTMRTIAIVHGRTVTAFFLGLFEISLWLVVVSAVITQISQEPILGVFYALGFSTGSVVGIKLEKRLALGCMGVRIINRHNSHLLTDELRKAGYRVTIFSGEGRNGPVYELYAVCRRRDLGRLLKIVNRIEPDAFYVTEAAGEVSRVYRPTLQPATGWRAILKKK
jgi:uncharacterized protein YebE (UPF0316 family)